MLSRVITVGLALVGAASLSADVVQPRSVQPCARAHQPTSQPTLYAGEDIFGRGYNAEEHTWRIARARVADQARQLSSAANVKRPEPSASSSSFYDATRSPYDFSARSRDRGQVSRTR